MFLYHSIQRFPADFLNKTLPAFIVSYRTEISTTELNCNVIEVFVSMFLKVCLVEHDTGSICI